MPTPLEPSVPRPPSTISRQAVLTAVALSAFSVVMTLSNPPRAPRTEPVVAAAATSTPSLTTAHPAAPPPAAPSKTSTPAASPAATAPASDLKTPAPASTPTARFVGPGDGAMVGAASANNVTFTFEGVPADRVSGSLDGTPVTFDGTGTGASHRAAPLAEGTHTLEATVRDANGDTDVRRTFTVDTTAPALAVAKPPAGVKGAPFVLKGTTDPGTKLTANGRVVSVVAGTWQAQFTPAPSAVRVVAEDEAGNTSTKSIAVQFPIPMTRAVHMTARAWGYKPKREAAMALLRAGKINAIQVDIKDEDGLVGYASKVPLANAIGAVEPHYDTKKMIAEIHGAGGRVIGRLVAFRDPTLTRWAWTTGRRDLVLQKLDGTPFTGSYGDYAFPNFANRTVQKYNVDLAVEAAKLGFDDVLYDYIRRPDGKLADMRIPGLRGTPERAVANTVVATKAGFQQAGVTTYLGVSVFGIAATRPREIAQDVAMMAPHVDYVAPMVYPSHWAKGEYDVADPNNQPYEIVQRSLLDFQAKVRGTNAVVVPWLQDFSLGVKYGPAQVRAQIKAAADDDMPSFLLWNAQANYQAAALDPRPKPKK